MANLKIKSNVTAEFTLTITEQEARALAAITGYSTDDFLKVFYQHMGSYYLQPHEKGVYSLFETLRGLNFQLAALDKAQKVAREEVR